MASLGPPVLPGDLDEETVPLLDCCEYYISGIYKVGNMLRTPPGQAEGNQWLLSLHLASAPSFSCSLYPCGPAAVEATPLRTALPTQHPGGPARLHS